MERFTDRVAVVTGAASGIGRAVARRAAAEGMRVVLADVDTEALDAARRDIAGAGGRVLAVATDVSKPRQVDALARRTLDAFGAVHLVHSNAGVLVGGFAWEKTLDDWRFVLDVNLFGAIHAVRAFVPVLLEQDDGHFVQTASVGGLVAGPLFGPYTVSKFGAVALCESLHAELAMRGSRVKVSCLCPAEVSTRIYDSERSRPADYAEASGPPVSDPAARSYYEACRAGVAAGIDPADVADHVFRALREERFWIFPHPEIERWVRDRAEDIAQGRVPAPPRWTDPEP